MIICAIDDLIFSIKISTAAKHLGADVFFERSPDRHRPARTREATVTGHLRSEQPEAEAAGGDRRAQGGPRAAALRDARVRLARRRQRPLRRRARLGIDQVMARSAFTQQLPEILYGSPEPPDERGAGRSDDDRGRDDRQQARRRASESPSSSTSCLRIQQAGGGTQLRRRRRPHSGTATPDSARPPSAQWRRVLGHPRIRCARRRRAAMMRPARRQHLVEHRANGIDVGAFVGWLRRALPPANRSRAAVLVAADGSKPICVPR